MIHKHVMTWTMGRITEKHKKWEMHTVGPAISRETWNRGNEPQTIFERKYGEKLKNVKNKKCTLLDLEYGKVLKNVKKWNMPTVLPGNIASKLKNEKMRHKHTLTRSMERSPQKYWKREMYTVGPGVWRETEGHGKWETHKVRPGIWQETVKTVKI